MAGFHRRRLSTMSMITAGLVGHYDASKIVGNAGDLIATWPDRSPSNNTASQSVDTRKPIIYDENGKRYARLDGARVMTLASSVPLRVPDKTVLVACITRGAPGTGDGIVSLGSSNNWTAGLRSTYRMYVYYADAAGNIIQAFATAANAVIANQSQILGWRVLSGETVNVTGYIDGDAKLTVATAGDMSTTYGSAPVIGSRTATPSGGYTGDIGEILIYNRALSDAEMVYMSQVLRGKW